MATNKKKLNVKGLVPAKDLDRTMRAVAAPSIVLPKHVQDLVAAMPQVSQALVEAFSKRAARALVKSIYKLALKTSKLGQGKGKVRSFSPGGLVSEPGLAK